MPSSLVYPAMSSAAVPAHAIREIIIRRFIVALSLDERSVDLRHSSILRRMPLTSATYILEGCSGQDVNQCVAE
jgi:hypothetical protein